MSHSSSSPATGGHKNETSSGAGAATATAATARKIAIAQQHHYNIEAMKYYAAGVLGLVAIFAIFHWTRYTYSRFSSRGVRKSKLMKAQVSIARAVRHVLTHRVPFFTSVGHAVLVLAYLGINAVLTVTNVDVHSGQVLAIGKRVGWMAMGNAAFITFLALKNTPLAYLTAYSYERLNILHQLAGYTTVTFALLHMILMCYAWIVQRKMVSILTSIDQINGMIAMAAMFFMAVFAALIRRIRYEVFYVSHIVGFMLFLITMGMHRRELNVQVIIITATMAGVWGADRVIRAWRIMWYSYDNKAIVTPLPHGGTRIVISRSPSRSVPGTHCFIWVPKIRLFETHPFTIVQKTPHSLELVISAYDGFTSELHEYALKYPGAQLRASFDGPYGSLPDFSRVADRLVLVAGGTGASFTFGVALDVLHKLKESSQTTIEFIWTVREEETLTWFQKELKEIRASPRVNAIIHTTCPSQSSTTGPSDDEKRLHLTTSIRLTPPTQTRTHSSGDLEKQPTQTAWDSTSSFNAISGRPDVQRLITDAVAKAGPEERVVIAACGPDKLMQDVRRTAANCITVNGPSVELHCEQFGW